MALLATTLSNKAGRHPLPATDAKDGSQAHGGQIDHNARPYRSSQALDRWLGETKCEEYWHHLSALRAFEESLHHDTNHPKL